MGQMQPVVPGLEAQGAVPQKPSDWKTLFSRRSPKPIPYDPDPDCLPLSAWEVFAPKVISQVIEENEGWLQVTPRSTQTIVLALFPRFTRAGMSDAEIFQAVGVEMYDMGYTPHGAPSNPTWTFPV